MGKFIDMRGLVFSRLTVLAQGEVDSNKNITWWCLCECGELVCVAGNSLRHNNTKSCGCLNIDRILERNTTHGQRHTKLYEIWKSMKQRCYNIDNKGYKYYGDKGISLCDEWLNSFISFKSWADLYGYREGLSIDRINPNGNYEPSNCEWVTRSENTRRSNNTRRV